MKLSDLPTVHRTQKERERIIEDLAALEIGLFNLTVRGTAQDDALAARVRPVIEAELKARLASLDRNLVANGVKVDC